MMHPTEVGLFRHRASWKEWRTYLKGKKEYPPQQLDFFDCLLYDRHCCSLFNRINSNNANLPKLQIQTIPVKIPIRCFMGNERKEGSFWQMISSSTIINIHARSGRGGKHLVVIILDHCLFSCQSVNSFEFFNIIPRNFTKTGILRNMQIWFATDFTEFD